MQEKKSSNMRKLLEKVENGKSYYERLKAARILSANYLPDIDPRSFFPLIEEIVSKADEKDWDCYSAWEDLRNGSGVLSIMWKHTGKSEETKTAEARLATNKMIDDLREGVC
jgi:hypothetical protein